MNKQAPFRISAGYIIAVGVIYLITSCAWLYLGQVTSKRTDEADLQLGAPSVTDMKEPDRFSPGNREIPAG